MNPQPHHERNRRHFGADDQVSLNRLVPGVVVRRYTEPAIRGDGVEIAVPCCDRLARVRRVEHLAHAWIGCPFCGLLYNTTLIDELDGGYAAVLEVRTEQVALARRRSRRRGPSSRP